MHKNAGLFEICSSCECPKTKEWIYEDVGSNPDTIYWIDISVASYYIERKIVNVAKWGTPKKSFKKNGSLTD
jgi:hypothetical protein